MRWVMGWAVPLTKETPAIGLNMQIVMSIRPFPSSSRPSDREVRFVRGWIRGKPHVTINTEDDILDRQIRYGRIFVTDNIRQLADKSLEILLGLSKTRSK
jgi:hypothetical protein